MNKYFDAENNRLIFEKEEATSDFWDKHWGTSDIKKYVKNISDNNLVVVNTKKFIPTGKKILEGGCGRGQFVYSLDKNGYDVYGIDYAEKTIKEINKNLSLLKVYYDDVKNLSFKDDFFDGYWSLGVIEHFYDGYGKIMTEMQRVIKKDGFLFLTHPHMNFLRILKARLGFYKDLDKENFDKGKFYQFALDYKVVVKDLEKLGFELVYKKGLSGAKGLKDGVDFLKPLLSKMYKSRNIFARILKKLISKLLSPLCGHSVLLVFKKIK